MLYTAKSHIGLVRQMNQDSYVVQPLGERTLVVVADGMGGAAAGEIASQMATQVIVSEVAERLDTGVQPAEALREAITKANEEIWRKSQSDVDCLGMGTTLVAALYEDAQVVLAHVGDSRAYSFHEGTLHQVTRDHSLVAELVRRGQITENEALSHPQRNVITRSLGTAQWSDAEIETLPLTDGDILLLCTDGLSNCVTNEEIAQHLQSFSGHLAVSVDTNQTVESDSQGEGLCLTSDVSTIQEAGTVKLQEALEGAAHHLIELTLGRGAPDNVTLVLTLHRKETGRH